MSSHACGRHGTDPATGTAQRDGDSVPCEQDVENADVQLRPELCIASAPGAAEACRGLLSVCLPKTRTLNPAHPRSKIVSVSLKS